MMFALVGTNLTIFRIFRNAFSYSSSVSMDSRTRSRTKASTDAQSVSSETLDWKPCHSVVNPSLAFMWYSWAPVVHTSMDGAPLASMYSRPTSSARFSPELEIISLIGTGAMDLLDTGVGRTDNNDDTCIYSLLFLPVG